MGVHGLWKLLEPSGKPVPVETLENHVLAVDVSIWLHQLLQGYRDGGGSSLPNAHLLGLFQRVCKLLFFRIKPVFVFDGGVPALKKKTIATRHQQKDRATIASEKARQQLLKNLLKQRAVSQVLGELNAIPSSSTSQQKKDLYELPPIVDEDDNSDIESIHSNSSESEDDHKKKKKYKDLHAIDVHGSDFKSLPADIRHDILTELKEKRKENSWGRIHEMPEDLGQFSNFQMNRLLKRRSVQLSLEEAEKEMGGRTFSLGDVEALLIEQGIQTSDVGNRIASDNVTRFLYITDSVKDSGKSVDKAKKQGDSVQPKEDDVVDSCSKETLDSVKDCKSSRNELETHLDETTKSTEKEHLSSIKEESTESQIFNEINLEEGSNSSEDITFEDLNEEFEMNRKLIIENSGLTQDQILTIIKEQNKKSSVSINKICKASISSVEKNEFIDISSENNEDSNISDSSSFKALNTLKTSDKRNNSPEIDSENFQDKNSSVVANQSVINNPECEDNGDTSIKLTNPNYNETDEKSTLSKLSNNSDKKIVMKTEAEVVNSTNNKDNLELASPKTHSFLNNDDDFVEVIETSKKSDPTCEIKSTNSTVVQVTINTKPDNDNNDEDIFADVFDNVSRDNRVLDSSDVTRFDQSNDVEIMGSSDTSSSETEEVNDNGPVNNEDIKSDLVEDLSDLKHDGPAIYDNRVSESNKNDEENSDQTIVKDKDASANVSLNDSLHTDDTNPDEANEIHEDSSKKPSKKLTTKELSKLQTILEKQEEQLVQKQGKEERIASTVTEQMRLEAQELLQLFGVPWVMAPMEAEAQCAFLDCIGLTQGTITDDSDVWLFGARKVYKNFFNQKKYVLQFQAQDIQHYFKLSRGDLIELALLVGSDYTSGVTGVGPVTALEILAMFRPSSSNDSSILTTLTAFKNWLQHPNNSSSPLASKLKDVQLEEGFPSKDVVEAYLHPMVDESDESFSWGFPDLDGLREFTKRKFGWSQTRTDEMLLPVVKNLSKKTSQSKIDSYFQFKPSIPVYKDKVSQRVQKAIYRLGGDSSSISGQFESRAGSSGTSQRQRKSRGGLQNRRTSGRGTTLQIEPTPPPKPPPFPTDELIPQRERDRLEALKRKIEAIEVVKAKGTKKAKRRPPRGPIKKEANLSESSSDEN